jgi:hypothetical protein
MKWSLPLSHGFFICSDIPKYMRKQAHLPLARPTNTDNFCENNQLFDFLELPEAGSPAPGPGF